VKSNVRTRAVAALALVEVAVVGSIATHEPNSGTGAVVLALLLAPLAVWVVGGIATAVAGPRFGIAAAAVYVALPIAARGYFYGAFAPVYRHDVLPALVGLRAPWWFALGVGVAVAVRVVPGRLAAASALVAVVVALVVDGSANWTALFGNFHESTWSPTLLCVLGPAGAIGLAKRAPALAATLGGWLAVLVLRGVHAPYGTGGFWLSLSAAAPAAALLVSGLGLLVPDLRAAGRRVRAEDRAVAP